MTQVEEAPSPPRAIKDVVEAAHLVQPMIAVEDPEVTGPIEVLVTHLGAQELRNLNVISVRRRGARNGEEWLVAGHTTQVSIQEDLVPNLMRPARLQLETVTSGNVMKLSLGPLALTGKEQQAQKSNLTLPTPKTFPR